MRIEPVQPDHHEILKLIQDLDAYQAALYPAESNHLDGLETLKQSNVIMAGALDTDNHILGMGAVKFMAGCGEFSGYGEIKRMFVPESQRKKGIAQKLLQTLEYYTMARHLPLIRLETGIHQKAAIGLYRAAGFKITGPFGDYPADPLSVFMEKSLSCFSDVLFISPYTPEDHDQVIALWQACGLIVPWNNPDDDIQRKLVNSSDLFFLARLGDLVIGSCMAGYDGHRGWFYYLGVAPEFRQLGVADKLIQHGESALAALGCPKINLMVRQTNTGVIRFYKKNGYEDDPVLVLSKRIISDS